MSEYAILNHCSPVLAGIKTGNMVSMACASKEEAMRDLRRWNRELAGKGLWIIPLRFGSKRVLLYICRIKALKADLKDPEKRAVLRKCGYTDGTVQSYLCQLTQRIRAGEDFPHEIGIFLGYPCEDVRGFIAHKGSGCKYCGSWKVYGDVPSAIAAFEKYRQCRESYCRQYRAGKSLKDLAVAS